MNLRSVLTDLSRDYVSIAYEREFTRPSKLRSESPLRLSRIGLEIRKSRLVRTIRLLVSHEPRGRR